MRPPCVPWCGSPHRAGELPPEEGEHREHAAVILGGGGEPQLPEDAGDVLLYGTLRDDEALCDGVVRLSFGHQLEHLALARRQRVERVVAPAAPDETRDDARVERRAALGH